MENYWTTVGSADAAFQWWRSDASDVLCVKGNIKLLSLTNGKDCYVISYSGKWSEDCHDRHGDAMGMFPLPHPTDWNITQSKFKSANSKARAMIIEFPSNQQLAKIQITIPFDGKGKAEKNFIDAFLSVVNTAK